MTTPADDEIRRIDQATLDDPYGFVSRDRREDGDDDGHLRHDQGSPRPAEPKLVPLRKSWRLALTLGPVLSGARYDTHDHGDRQREGD